MDKEPVEKIGKYSIVPPSMTEQTIAQRSLFILGVLLMPVSYFLMALGSSYTIPGLGSVPVGLVGIIVAWLLLFVPSLSLYGNKKYAHVRKVSKISMFAAATLMILLIIAVI